MLSTWSSLIRLWLGGEERCYYHLAPVIGGGTDSYSYPEDVRILAGSWRSPSLLQGRVGILVTPPPVFLLPPCGGSLVY